jgi:hypothetical protein
MTSKNLLAPAMGPLTEEISVLFHRECRLRSHSTTPELFSCINNQAVSP